MSQKDSIRLISYDLEGVFFKDPKASYIENLAKYYNKTEEFIEELLFHKAITEGKYNELKEGKINSKVYWDWLFDSLGIDDIEMKSKHDYLSHAMGYYEINSNIVKLIGKLKKHGVGAFLCSNNYKDKIQYLENKYSLSKYFDLMVFSYEIGFQKPDVRIFKHVVDKSELEPSQILYTDNKKDKLVGAEKIGMKVHIYENYEKFVRYLQSLGLRI